MRPKGDATRDVTTHTGSVGGKRVGRASWVLIVMVANAVLASSERYRLLVLAGLALVLVMTLALAVCLGPMPISTGTVASVIAHKLGLASASGTSVADSAVVWVIRMPRVFLAAGVGAMLAVSGAVLQGLFRNPLVDPGLIGVSSGAALGAAGYIVFGGSIATAIGGWVPDGYGRAIAAFLGGLGATIVVFRLSGKHGQTSLATLLLAGIAINAIGGAGLGLFTFVSDDRQLRDLAFWSLGSFGGASWRACWLVVPVAVTVTGLFAWRASTLNVFLLGESEAGHLGVNVQRLKRILITLVAFGVGLGVAFTGIIGFIGLVTPHLLRLAFGPDHRTVIPGAALLGAALTVAADTIARTAVAPAELPVGVLTALLGGPFFLWLLMRQRGMEI